MRNVIFLETDPAFMLAYRAYGELGPRLNPIGTQTAELDPLLSTNGNTDFSQNNPPYDFGRRVAVAARISMCVATGLPLRNWADNQHHIEPHIQVQQGGQAFSLDNQQLDDFIAHFDQMFPHHVIREKLQNQNNFPLTSRILIFRLENNIAVDIVEMIVTINIVNVNNFGNMNCSISTRAIKSLLSAGEDGPWYKHLQSICFQPVDDVHLPCVEEHEHEQEQEDESDSESDDADEDHIPSKALNNLKI